MLRDAKLRYVLSRSPEVWISDKNKNLHGWHNRFDEELKNRIFLSEHLLNALDYAGEDSEVYWTHVYMILTTLGHEYGHWVLTMLNPEIDWPEKLGYSFTHRRKGEGESGYVSEIALFGFYTHCDPVEGRSGEFTNFRAIDRFNAAHALPLHLIKSLAT